MSSDVNDRWNNECIDPLKNMLIHNISKFIPVSHLFILFASDTGSFNFHDTFLFPCLFASIRAPFDHILFHTSPKLRACLGAFNCRITHSLFPVVSRTPMVQKGQFALVLCTLRPKGVLGRLTDSA